MMRKEFDMVLFGGTGDLSMRKLLPAMYKAFCHGDIVETSRIFVCCRDAAALDTLPECIHDALLRFLDSDEFDSDLWNNFKKLLHPTYLDVAEQSKGWADLQHKLNQHQQRARVYYLAVMPSLFSVCCENLSAFELISEQSRLVVEKPLGYDYTSAEQINESIARFFTESQIYRIDHYLGKAPVQNLLALRLSNFLFENIWDHKSIDHVQIRINEQVGLEGRGEFYDGTGAMRDMVQNHLLQLLCLVAMEPPNRLDADAIRLEKIKVLQALQPITGEDFDRCCVRGQYVSGEIKGEKVRGYLDELEKSASNTETYVALRAKINNWRWSGVPFYLRTGKRMKKRSAEIIVQFKAVSHNVYAQSNQQLQPNCLVIQLQPEEKIQLFIMSQAVGSDNSDLKPLALNLDYHQQPNIPRCSAYQKLLLDVIDGDASLFIHRDEIRAAWQWVDPIIAHWHQHNIAPELYRAGSYGPTKANEIFESAEQTWLDIDKLQAGQGSD